MVIDDKKYNEIKQDLLNVMNSFVLVCSKFVSIEFMEKPIVSKKGNLISVDFTPKKDEVERLTN